MARGYDRDLLDSGTIVLPDAQVGTSGYSYSEWKGSFYPEGLPLRDQLRCYASRFGSVEINMTFYSPPRENVLQRWRRIVPHDFAFVLKASQVITHQRRLADCGEGLARMFEQYEPLGPQLSCVLFQLPPSLHANHALLDRFLGLAWTELERSSISPRLAMEFRHGSWNTSEIFARLKDRGWAMVVHDMPGAGAWKLRGGTPCAGEIGFDSIEAFVDESPFVYLRFHGTTGRYAGGYGADRLRPWAELGREAMKRAHPFLAFFNNTVGGAAHRDAASLSTLLRDGDAARSSGG